MTAIAAPSARSILHRAARRHPQYGAVLAAVLAWSVLLAQHTTAGHQHARPAAQHLLMWTLMSVAMMVPVALPAVRHVAANSLAWRRQRAIGGFLGAYLLVWVGLGVALTPVARAWPDHRLLAAALVVAAGWVVLPTAGRFRRACHRTVPLPPRGWPATRGTVLFGLRHGVACLGMCWPLMTVMAVAGSPALWWMAGLSAASAAVKLRQRTAPPVAVLLATAAVVVLLRG